MVTRLYTYLGRFALLSPANLASNVASQRTCTWPYSRCKPA